MSDPRLLGIGRAVPERRYRQEALYEHNPWTRTPLLDRLFLDSPVIERALFVPPEWYFEPRTLSDTNRAWREGSLLLGSAALREVLDRTHTDATAVDWIGVTSVTGYTTPGLDLLLAKGEGLRPNVARAHFNNIGCHAAVPLLKVASDHVHTHGGRAALVAVEICSACFSDSDEAQNLVAVALFADGAASALVGTTGEGPRIVGFSSRYDFDHMDALGFGLTSSGFRIVLDPSIPELIATHIASTVDDLLERHAVSREQVAIWALHPGGSRILDASQRALGLSDQALAPSRHVLAHYGNMSSPSVLFVLAEALRARHERGGFAVVAAFGPGLGIEACLLEL